MLGSESYNYLAAIVLGWVLSELSRHFAGRRERKEAIARTLADLLELRNQSLGIEMATREIFGLVAVPQQQKPAVRLFLEQVAPAFLPNQQQIHQRYDQSVSALAAYDPVLAYQMRSKNLMRPLLSQLAAIANADPSAATVAANVEDELTKVVHPALKQAILLLAWKRSLLTLIRSWRCLRRQEERPKELDAFLSMLKDAMKAAPQAPAGNKAASAVPGGPKTDAPPGASGAP